MKTWEITYWIILTLASALVVYYFYPETKLPINQSIDTIVVYKSKRQLLAYSHRALLKTYRISLGQNSIGCKEFEGDQKTPEGIYYINDKNANSDYHRSLGISYPNKYDLKRAAKNGKSAGGDIKIHGIRNRLGFLGKLQRQTDWTKGCVALTNQEIDELYNAVSIGTVVEIKP